MISCEWRHSILETKRCPDILIYTYHCLENVFKQTKEESKVTDAHVLSGTEVLLLCLITAFFNVLSETKENSLTQYHLFWQHYHIVEVVPHRKKHKNSLNWSQGEEQEPSNKMLTERTEPHYSLKTKQQI